MAVEFLLAIDPLLRVDSPALRLHRLQEAFLRLVPPLSPAARAAVVQEFLSRHRLAVARAAPSPYLALLQELRAHGLVVPGVEAPRARLFTVWRRLCLLRLFEVRPQLDVPSVVALLLRYLQ